MARITSRATLAVGALLAFGAGPASAAGAPKASFRVSPAKPAVGATLVLDGGSSKCSPGPCKFLWTSTTTGRRSVKLGTQRRVSLKLKVAETLSIALRVTDKRKRVATRRQKIVVAAATPPLAPVFTPAAPVFTPPAPVSSAPPPAPPSDTEPPGAPLISAPTDGSLGNAATVLLTGTAEPGATIEVREAGTLLTTVTADAAGRWVCTLTMLTEGRHVFVVTARDAAGNSSVGATRSFTLDRTAPAAPVVDATQTGSAVTLGGTAEAGATIEIREAAVIVGTATADAQGRWTRTLTSVPSGPHTYSVTARDLAGNISAASTLTLAPDASPPDTAITAGPSGLTNASPITFAFSSTESGSTFRCRLDRAGSPGEWDACVSPAVHTELVDGQYTFRVRASDPSGNEDPSESLSSFTLDRTAPPVPTIVGPALQNVSVVMLRGTAEAGALVQLREGDAELATTTADAQGAWDHALSGVTDGSHTYSVTAHDAAGNVSAPATRAVVVDTTPPETTLDVVPAALTNAETLRFEFHASEAASSFACRLDVGTEPGEWAICASPRSYVGLADGNHTFLVRATDPAGNTDAVIARHEFRVDRTAPSAPSLDAPALQNSPTVALSGTAEPFSTVEIREGDDTLGTASADGDGKWSRGLAAVPDGVHTYTAIARDAAGNASAASQRTVVVDTTAPTVTITAGPDGRITDSTATFAFTSEPGAKLECRFDGPDATVGVFAACTSPFTRTQLDAGAFVFAVRATDAAGNTGAAATRSFSFSPQQHETVFIASDGDDAGPCTNAAPCATLARAYAYAADGGVIEVGDGSYGDQHLPAGEKRVTVRGAGGSRPSLRQLQVDTDDVTFRNLVVEQLRTRGSRQVYDGVDVDGRFTRRLAFEHISGDDVTFKNGSIGNVTDEKGVIVGPARFTFDNVVFHDVRVTDQAIHNECVYASGSEGLTIRNSTFHACATMDLFFTNFEGGADFGNITLENNVFEHTTMEAPDSWHFYTVVVHPVVKRLMNWVVRYNTFETGVSTAFDRDAPSSSGRWVGNLGDWVCEPGIVYRYNVGQPCGDLDSGVSPSASTRNRPAAFKWVDPAAYDFRLGPGSPAIDVGDPEDYPQTDRNGDPRNVGWGPDAGALERQTAP